MNPNTFPTKGNLILAKNSLALANQGFDLMDKKRNILDAGDHGPDRARPRRSRPRSMPRLPGRLQGILQKANIEMGIHYVEEIAGSLSRHG